MADCLEGDCLKLKRKRVEESKNNSTYESLLVIFERLMDLTEKSVDYVRPYLKPIPLSPYMDEKFQEGLPLADRKNFPVPDPTFNKLLDTFFDGLAGISDKIEHDILILKNKRKGGEISGQRLIDQFVMGSKSFLSYLFDIPDINNYLLFFVIRDIFRICLVPYQNTLTDELAGLWDKGDCPICGFPPDIGILRGEGGKLYLHCAICGHEWRFNRMVCAFCGSDLQKEHNYLEIEGDNVHKIFLCNFCRRYLKVLDSRSLPDDTLLFLDLEDLTTLHLDVIADEKGYLPGINV